MPVFHYTVDDVSQTTSEHTLTPTQILQNARIDPQTNYLVQIVGNHQVSYREKPMEPIRMHQNMKFVSVPLGPTPVS